jgi:hypothetical protein
VHGVQGLLAIWNRWDTQAYQQLAHYGYHISGEFKTWFYPLFPWRVRLVAWVSGNYIVSAFIVSGVASVVAALLLRRTVELERRATHAANVSDFHALCFIGRQPILERNSHGVFFDVPRLLRQPVCLATLGVLSCTPKLAIRHPEDVDLARTARRYFLKSSAPFFSA